MTVALALFLAVLAAFQERAPAAEDSGAALREWTVALRWLSGERDELAADLERARRALLARARDSAPELARDLGERATEVRAHGYQLLPAILPDAEPAALAPVRTTYSLEHISTAYAWAVRDAAVLAEVAELPQLPHLDRSEALAPLVERYRRLCDKLANLEEHIAYHSYWQERAVAEPDFFAERNAILARVEEWDALRRSGADPAREAELRRAWSELLAPFRPTPGLALRREPGGELVLPVAVATDIEDEAFLSHFAAAVHAAFDESSAARARHMRVELTFARVAPGALYGAEEAVPARGAEIDEAAHVARFPAGALVLTTGAQGTHSYVGRSIQLGTDPLPARTLAHEFAHLLGFQDAYLRAFTGDPSASFGVVLVEWTGLVDGLMGDARGGVATAEMIDQLIEAYIDAYSGGAREG